LDEQKAYTKDLKDFVSQTLRVKAEGTFLWVSLACRELQREPKTRVKTILDRLPAGLVAMYQQLVSQILQNEEADILKHVLVSMLVAFRPLRLRELAITADLPKDHQDDVSFIKEYVNQCGSLMTCRDEEANFVHQSVKDYLLSCDALTLSSHLEQENWVLARRCFRYTCSKATYLRDSTSRTQTAQMPNRPLTVETSEILEYPLLFWMEHGRLSGGNSRDLYHQDPDFWKPESSARQSFWKLFNQYPNGYDENVVASSITLAAVSGITELVREILLFNSGKSKVKSENGWSFWKFKIGDNGTEKPVVEGDEYATALYTATRGGHEAVVKLLIERGANVNAQGGRYGTALQAAAWGGQEAVVKLLIERSANVNAQGGKYGNAIQAAASEGEDAVIGVLICEGVDLLRHDILGRNALRFAMRGNHIRTVQLLLDEGVGWRPKDIQECSDIHFAASGGCVEALNQIIAADVEINSSDTFRWTALHWSCRSGSFEACQLLISCGGDVTKKDKTGWTALDVAVFCRNSSLVPLFPSLATTREPGKIHGAYCDCCFHVSQSQRVP
jgi:ankyrin repeat protein